MVTTATSVYWEAQPVPVATHVCVCASLFLYLHGYKWNKRHEKVKGPVFNVKLFMYKGTPVFVVLCLLNSHLNESLYNL